jgi:hypothetical protein
MLEKRFAKAERFFINGNHQDKICFTLAPPHS